MKIYDKAAWHIDADENPNEVVEKFKIIFSFLKMKNMLNSEGLEIFDLGIDQNISLHVETTGSFAIIFCISRSEQPLKIFLMRLPCYTD